MASELQQQIKKDMIVAMKEKNELGKQVLRMVSAEIRNAEIDKPGHELTDEDVMKVLMRLEKQRKDSIKQYQEGGREDLAEAEQAELAVIGQYLPEKLSDEEVAAIVHKVIAESDSKDFGTVMKAVMTEVKGQADGNQVRQLVQAKLA